MNENIHKQAIVPFNRPTITGTEEPFVLEALKQGKLGPGGPFVQECQNWLTQRFTVSCALPTGSCTAALEISAILLELKPGDEVILPSFAYPSTANAFVRAGARLVFVDIDPKTMNLDPQRLEAAINANTRAIVLVHYAGVTCDMDRVSEIANRFNLVVIEDAALAFLAKHRDRWCGTLGTFGCFSFHETKTVHCGQGGALLINDPNYVERAEIVLEKGTDRRKYIRNEIDKYSWRDIGSAYALDNIRSAFLFGQFLESEMITAARLELWWRYYQQLSPLASGGRLEIPSTPDYAELNGHVFWLKAIDEIQRDSLIQHLADHGVHAVFHYVPLHSSVAGQRFGRFSGDDVFTTRDAARLVRLPLFYRLSEIDFVVELIFSFYDSN